MIVVRHSIREQKLMRSITPLFFTVVLAACNSTSYTTEMQPLTQSPAASKRQAEKICEGAAQQARARAASNDTAYRGTCTENYVGDYDCEVSSYQNVGVGLGGALNEFYEQQRAADGVYESCLARYGWEEVRVPVDG
jgi:hypothetical protein